MQELVGAVQHGCWDVLARRRVQHFGYKFDYTVRPMQNCHTCEAHGAK